MSDWRHALPLGWMAILIFGTTFLVAAAIDRVVQSLAVGERARAFQAVSPGLLPPLGLVGQHIQDAQEDEWPAMAHRQATITIVPAALGEAMQTTLALPVQSDGQVAAQQAVVAALERALDARRQRILIGQSHVNGVKWISLFIQALCTLIAIAIVHSDNRASATIALGLFSTAVAVCILLITAHDRPFIGQNAVQPTVLLQVQPNAAVENTAR